MPPLPRVSCYNTALSYSYRKLRRASPPPAAAAACLCCTQWNELPSVTGQSWLIGPALLGSIRARRSVNRLAVNKPSQCSSTQTRPTNSPSKRQPDPPSLAQADWRLRFFVITSPALEKSLLLATNVTGIASRRHATLATSGYDFTLAAHQRSLGQSSELRCTGPARAQWIHATASDSRSIAVQLWPDQRQRWRRGWLRRGWRRAVDFKRFIYADNYMQNVGYCECSAA